MVAQWITLIRSQLPVPSLLATALVALLPYAAVAQPTAAVSDYVLREARIPLGTGTQPAPKYSYLFSPTARWKGPLRWRYNHAGAPPQLASDKAAVIDQIKRAFDKWSSQCGITYVYEGETTTPPNTLITSAAGTQPDGASVVGWGVIDPSFGAWTYAWYAQDGNDRVIFDADVTLNAGTIATLADVDRLMTHEWGHALGLDHSSTESALMAGPPSTQYTHLVTPQSDDLRGCRCQYGLPSGVSAPYACSVPEKVDFGNAAPGSSSATQTVTFTNSGNAPLSIQLATIADSQFRHVAGCAPGTVVMPGASCTLQMQAVPSSSGAIASKMGLYTNDGNYELALVANGMSGSPPSGGPTVDVVEYYNAALDHYFITWIAAEITNLDAGLTPTRWTRTGRMFKAFAVSQSGTSQVCRFYIPPSDGNSHFFGRSAGECNATAKAQPDFVLEDPSYMHIVLPAAGTCPSGLRPVYRMFNNRLDANHRYTVDRAVRDEMVAKGWLAEGDGDDRVVMCAPA